uniref:Uncharacterized protein n=1 Tax=Ditylenchus dipsaci TaxID=166011 RepID=A0A915DYT6_9BILA
MAGNDVKAKDSEKFALFKKIQDSKLLLFGKFSETVTKQAQDLNKTAKQLRNRMWNLTKTRTIAKFDAARKTGNGGVAMFSEIEKLVLVIVDAESPQVSGLDVAETEFFSPRPSISTPIPPASRKKTFAKVTKDDGFLSSLNDQIKEEKLRKLEPENHLLSLTVYEKQLQRNQRNT